MSMRIDLQVLSSFDFIMTTSTGDSECMRVRESVSVRLKGRCPNPNIGEEESKVKRRASMIGKEDEHQETRAVHL